MSSELLSSYENSQYDKVYQTGIDGRMIEIYDKNNKNINNSQVQIVVKQYKKISKKKNNLIKKAFSIQYIPTFKQIDDIESFFLVGELFIFLDFDNKYFKETRTSVINNFKRITETILHKKSKFLEVQLEYKTSSLKNFFLTAKKLANYPDQDVHELGVLLQIYQDYCYKCLEMLKQQGIQQRALSQEQIDLQKQQFNQKKFDYLNNFNQDEFIFVVEMRNNFKTLEFEMCSIYVSEPFLILLGTNLEQFERYIHRHGLSEFVDSRSQLKFNIFQLKTILKSFTVYTEDFPNLQNFDEYQLTETTLHTFDNIQILAKVQSYAILPEKGMSQCQDYQINPQMLHATRFEIEPNSIQQLIQIRQNQQSNQLGIFDQGYMNDIDFSLDYQLQSEVFFEIAKLHNLYTKTKQRSSYRTISENERQKIKHIEIVCIE